MLYPDFDELVILAGRAARGGLTTKRKTAEMAAGNYASPFRGQGLEFHEVREYRPGDDVRNIDWRVTARMNKPFMKVFTEERERTVLLCVDAGAAMRFGTRGTFKSVQAARAAALLGWMAQAGNDRVGALVFGDVPDGLQFIPPARSRAPLWRTLKLLCKKIPSASKEGISLVEALGALDRLAPTGALVFIISDFQAATEGFERILASLRRRCDVILVSVTDPADHDLPAMETVIFNDAHGRRLLAGTGSKRGREAYTRQWRENRQRLEDIAKRQRSGIIDLHTNTDVYTELTRGLSMIERQGSRR